MMKKVRIEKLNGRDIFSVIKDGLDSFGLSQRLKNCNSVFIKPNLVSDVLEYIQNGSNTDIRVIEGVLRYLSNYNLKVFLGESDNGPQLKGRKLKYALEYMGVYNLRKRYDFEIVNLTRKERKGDFICFSVLNRPIRSMNGRIDLVFLWKRVRYTTQYLAVLM